MMYCHATLHFQGATYHVIMVDPFDILPCGVTTQLQGARNHVKVLSLTMMTDRCLMVGLWWQPMATSHAFAFIPRVSYCIA